MFRKIGGKLLRENGQLKPRKDFSTQYSVGTYLTNDLAFFLLNNGGKGEEKEKPKKFHQMTLKYLKKTSFLKN